MKDEQSLQSCMLEWQASLQEPLKAHNNGDNQVYVEDVRIGADGTVLVFLTDKSRFEYHTATRLWREVNADIEMATTSSQSDLFKVATTSNVKIGTAGLHLSAEDLDRPINSNQADPSSLF